jgi:hypothetical protein
MGSRGREYVKANLLIEAITPRLLAMYQAVLQRQCHGA